MRLVAQGVRQSTLFGVRRLASRRANACAETPFGKHALEPAHQLLAGFVEVFEYSAEKAEHFVVSSLSPPRQYLVNGVHFLLR